MITFLVKIHTIFSKIINSSATKRWRKQGFSLILMIADILLERRKLIGFLPRLRPAFIGKKAVARWRHEWESSLFLSLSALLMGFSLARLNSWVFLI